MLRLCSYIILGFVTSITFASASDSIQKKKSFREAIIPAQITIQYGGNIGMISAGPTWNFLKDRLKLDYSVGYVPSIQKVKPIVSTSAKLIYSPSIILQHKRISINPVNVGFTFSYTFGDTYNRYENNSKYKQGYYWWTISTGTALLYQSEVTINPTKGIIDKYHLYLEASLWDLDGFSYFQNTNYKHLNPRDIVTLGLGIRLTL